MNRPHAAQSRDFPTSFAQRRLWFLGQLEPGSAFYNVPLLLRLRGRLEVDSLRQALTALVERHEALRTTFALGGAEPVQSVSPPQPFALALTSLENEAPAARETAADRLISEEIGRPFDLTTGPLFRGRLVRLDPADHLLILVLHHIVSDGWSLSVLLRELGTLYAAEPLPPLPLQYHHYAEWQRARLQGAALTEVLGYWRAQLEGAPPLLDLPTDRPRPAVQRYRGARRTLVLDPKLTDALGVVGRSEGATLFMTLLAAFGVLLGRYTGQTDVVVGTPIAGRTRTELEGLIGFFVNMLALRLPLAGAVSFRALLRKVREVALGAYTYQELPFECLVEELSPARSLQHQPLFQVVFAFQNTPRSALELPGLIVEQLPVNRETAKFDLALFITKAGAGLQAVVEYDRDLFDPVTIDRLLEHYRLLLAAAALDPDGPIASVPLTSPDERHRLLVVGKGLEVALPVGATIPELFQARAAEAPDATAIVSADTVVSYRELDRWSDRIAARLRAEGVKPDRIVGVLLDRSPMLIAALLGVLKAGGAYLPLDPRNPATRSQGLLRDAGASLLITDATLAASLGPCLSRVLRLDAEPEEDRPQVAPARGPAPHPDNLAYVVYTSGSTGVPKGVAVTHRNVARLLLGVDYARLASDEVFLQFAPVAFDASTFEIWGPLLHGARVVVAPPGLLTPEELGEVVRRHGVTTLWLTSGLFHLLVDERLEDLGGVGQLLAGGDILSPAHVARVLRELPGCRMINGYGPAETTTFATTATVRDLAPDASLVPIGRPIANTRVYVLDAGLQPQPVGLPGELYIGGLGVARGYLNRPGFTAERFLPDPFGGAAGARMYRTGDRARCRNDGTLEFLGRLDRQVKIRGFRVEPDEIQAVLARHPKVLDVALTVREDRPGDRRLVAYVVPDRVESAGTAELQAFLKEVLPDYMIPTTIVTLQHLPLTPNGKLDRGALPVPDELEGARSTAFVPPRTPLESVLAGIWRELLQRERIGVLDNFFELGGHSLLATQVVSRVRRLLGLELPVRVLFEEPTVAGLAARVSEMSPIPVDAQAPPLVRIPRGAYRMRPPDSSIQSATAEPRSSPPRA